MKKYLSLLMLLMLLIGCSGASSGGGSSTESSGGNNSVNVGTFEENKKFILDYKSRKEKIKELYGKETQYDESKDEKIKNYFIDLMSQQKSFSMIESKKNATQLAEDIGVEEEFKKIFILKVAEEIFIESKVIASKEDIETKKISFEIDKVNEKINKIPKDENGQPLNSKEFNNLRKELRELENKENEIRKRKLYKKYPELKELHKQKKDVEYKLYNNNHKNEKEINNLRKELIELENKENEIRKRKLYKKYPELREVEKQIIDINCKLYNGELMDEEKMVILNQELSELEDKRNIFLLMEKYEKYPELRELYKEEMDIMDEMINKLDRKILSLKTTTAQVEKDKQEIENLKTQVEANRKRIEEVAKENRQGIALTTAMAQINPLGMNEGKFSAGVGMGYFKGETGLAFGVGYGISEGVSVSSKGAVATGDFKTFAVGAGMNFEF